MSLTLYTRARLTQVGSINLLEKQIKTSFWYNCALPPHSLIFWKNVFVYSVINRYKHELIQMNKFYNCFSYFSFLFFCLLFCFIIYILYILKFKGGGATPITPLQIRPSPDPHLSRSAPLQIRTSPDPPVLRIPLSALFLALLAVLRDPPISSCVLYKPCRL